MRGIVLRGNYEEEICLAEITDGNGMKTSYAYDVLARLVSYTDVSGA